MSSRNADLDLFLPSLPMVAVPDGTSEMVKRKLKKIAQAHEMWSELRLFFLSVLFLFTFESKFSRMCPTFTHNYHKQRTVFRCFSITKPLILANRTKAVWSLSQADILGLIGLRSKFWCWGMRTTPKKGQPDDMTTDSSVYGRFLSMLAFTRNALCAGYENYLSGVEFAQKHIAKVLIKKHKENSLQTASQSGRRLLSTL